jgi:hypothetical protein
MSASGGGKCSSPALAFTVFHCKLSSMVLDDRNPVNECPRCGEEAYDHVKPGGEYEGSPIGSIRICVTEEGAFFHG